jgi:hypothetical protein
MGLRVRGSEGGRGLGLGEEFSCKGENPVSTSITLN